jgi:hypothetical protein
LCVERVAEFTSRIQSAHLATLQHKNRHGKMPESGTDKIAERNAMKSKSNTKGTFRTQ